MTLSPSNLVIQGFWSGPLTTMERLSMQSFIQNGHKLHVFSYGPLDGVPSGVEVLDAAEIVPESAADTFRCPHQLSDFFRIALLLKKGGWYTDLDNVLVRSLDLPEPFVFYRDRDETTISFALSKAPADSPIMAHCYEFLNNMSPEDREHLAWQEIGSDFALGAVEYFQMTNFTKPGRTFDPVGWDNVKSVVDPSVEWDLSQSYSVHLFHSVWNNGPEDRTSKGFNLGQSEGERLDTDATYHPDCLYEQLKARYL
jgi:hypothetical protein